MGAKTRLRARWVERVVDENMFGVLLARVCLSDYHLVLKERLGVEKVWQGYPKFWKTV